MIKKDDKVSGLVAIVLALAAMTLLFLIATSADSQEIAMVEFDLNPELRLFAGMAPPTAKEHVTGGDRVRDFYLGGTWLCMLTGGLVGGFLYSLWRH